MSSYQRLIVHRVAHYFRLDHAVFDMDGTKRSIVLFKTPQSRMCVSLPLLEKYMHMTH